MHATICMDIADAEMHMVERFLTPKSPHLCLSPSSFFFSLFLALSTSPSFTSPDYSHRKISKISHCIWCALFLCLKYINTLLFLSWFFCFLILFNFLPPHSSDEAFIVSRVLLKIIISRPEAWHLCGRLSEVVFPFCLSVENRGSCPLSPFIILISVSNET